MEGTIKRELFSLFITPSWGLKDSRTNRVRH